MTAAIMVPVHNRLDLAERCIRQIDATVPERVPLIIVDDASCPECHVGLSVILVGLSRPVELLRDDRQQLFTRAANRGLRYAYHHFGRPDVLFLVNSDCDLSDGWYDAAMVTLRFCPDAGLVGYRDQPHEEEWHRRAYTLCAAPPEYVTGHCLALRTRALEEVGILCETDTTGRDDPGLAAFHGQAHIGSERILGYRMHKAGWLSYYCNHPSVRHEAGQSWGHNLRWLAQFPLQPLWAPCDTLEKPVWVDGREVD